MCIRDRYQAITELLNSIGDKDTLEDLSRLQDLQPREKRSKHENFIPISDLTTPVGDMDHILTSSFASHGSVDPNVLVIVCKDKSKAAKRSGPYHIFVQTYRTHLENYSLSPISTETFWRGTCSSLQDCLPYGIAVGISVFELLISERRIPKEKYTHSNIKSFIKYLNEDLSSRDSIATCEIDWSTTSTSKLLRPEEKE